MNIRQHETLKRVDGKMLTGDLDGTPDEAAKCRSIQAMP